MLTSDQVLERLEQADVEKRRKEAEKARKAAKKKPQKKGKRRAAKQQRRQMTVCTVVWASSYTLTTKQRLGWGVTPAKHGTTMCVWTRR